ncbi:hypothetical protein TURU_120885 [Turdus rufiventris]|nr:hypothetical protein TURU_120885 [Turdus rufiventris]
MVAIIFLVWLVHSLFQYLQVVRDGVEKETCLCMEVCAKRQEQQRIWLLWSWSRKGAMIQRGSSQKYSSNVDETTNDKGNNAAAKRVLEMNKAFTGTNSAGTMESLARVATVKLGLIDSVALGHDNFSTFNKVN